jgi:carbon storage regulator
MMLVLTRKVDQGIVIAGNIYVRVLGVERDRVKIGISAPLDVAVLRQELLDREGGGKSKNSNEQQREPESERTPVPTREDQPNES